MIIEINPDASLDNRARATRSRLLRTIEVLDQRRHELTRIGNTAKNALVPISLGAVGLLVAGATAALVVQHRAIKRAKTDWRRSLVERLVPEPPPSGFLSEAGRRAGIALVLMSVTELAKRVFRSV